MKNYIAEMADYRGDSYLNPVGALYGDGTGAHNRPLSWITDIGVHHDATERPHDYDSVARYKQEAREHYNRLGPGLQYHFKIDNVGQIFWIRPLEMWLYALGADANVSTINICLDGYFHPDVNQKPTREQYEALKQLLDWLSTQWPQFSAAQGDVWPHRQFSPTACCGDTLVPFVNDYRNSMGNVEIPSGSVYDWPELQPQATPAPVSVDPITPPAPAIPPIKYEAIPAATYVAQVKTHLDDATTGAVAKDAKGNEVRFEPGYEFDLVRRMTKGDKVWLQTQYSVDHTPTRGIPEKDLMLKNAGKPTQPSEPDPSHEPPVITSPPTPTPAQQTHDYSQENNSLLKEILAVVKNIWDKLTGVSK